MLGLEKSLQEMGLIKVSENIFYIPMELFESTSTDLNYNAIELTNKNLIETEYKDGKYVLKVNGKVYENLTMYVKIAIGGFYLVIETAPSTPPLIPSSSPLVKEAKG